MGLMKDRHGTYYARVKVPDRLQEAVARVLDQGKERQSFLKKSLGTKDLKTANVRAKPALAKFDRVFSDAEQLLAARPMRESLSAVEIKRMAEIHYAAMLDTDETARREGTGSEPVFQSIAAQLTAAGVKFSTPFSISCSTPATAFARKSAPATVSFTSLRFRTNKGNPSLFSKIRIRRLIVDCGTSREVAA
jgi:hypothetical protein